MSRSSLDNINDMISKLEAAKEFHLQGNLENIPNLLADARNDLVDAEQRIAYEIRCKQEVLGCKTENENVYRITTGRVDVTVEKSGITYKITDNKTGAVACAYGLDLREIANKLSEHDDLCADDARDIVQEIAARIPSHWW